jgi:hypothetical protein
VVVGPAAVNIVALRQPPPNPLPAPAGSRPPGPGLPQAAKPAAAAADTIIECPSCRRKLKFAGAKRAYYADRPDLWLRCPGCGDRFKLPSADLAEIVSAGPDRPPARPAGRPAAGPAARPWLPAAHDHSPVASGPGYLILALAEAPPRGALRGRLVWTGLAALAALAVASTVFFFTRSVPPLAAEPDRPAAAAAAEYQDGRLAYDLSSLHRDMRQVVSLETTIGYQGAAWRLYDFFSRSWAPDSCQTWSEVRLWSLRTSRGFKARGICPAGAGEALEVEVTWRGDKAVVSAPGLEHSKTVNLARRPSS